ncbi:MAG: hypothetical protein WKG06_31620 [Segetibacter sp.]
MTNISTFDGGSNSFMGTSTTISPGAYRVADWDNEVPLIVAKDNVGPADAKRVDLNFYPPSSDSRSDFWSSSTDGVKIMANSLLYVARASSKNITTSALSSTSYCQGASLIIPYTANGTYNSDNTFTAQLSDASGSFTSPTNIGNVNATESGTINVTIPTTAAAGTGYRIRVVSSAPVVTGTDNGTDITINQLTAIASQPTAANKWVSENASFSVSATGSGTLTYQWQENSGSGWSNITDGGVYSGATSSKLNLTGVTYAMNGYQYKCAVTGDCRDTTSDAAALTVNKRLVTLAYTGGTAIQYSDKVNLSATLSDNSGSSITADLSGRTVTFTIGSQTTTATSNSAGVASTTLIITQAPGSYTVGVSFDGSGDLVYQSSALSPAPSFTINKEDANITFTSPEYIALPGATATSVTVSLSATVKDRFTGADAYPGKISNATVTFRRDNPLSGAVLGTANVPVGLGNRYYHRCGLYLLYLQSQFGRTNSRRNYVNHLCSGG